MIHPAPERTGSSQFGGTAKTRSAESPRKYPRQVKSTWDANPSHPHHPSAGRPNNTVSKATFCIGLDPKVDWWWKNRNISGLPPANFLRRTKLPESAASNRRVYPSGHICRCGKSTRPKQSRSPWNPSPSDSGPRPVAGPFQVPLPRWPTLWDG